ncbi:AP180 N-terminal homology (ANTH) domain-containing protein [Artemisia annua]|uniref:AP180 N-terminal homology (ANTH) domain-containing protein n=1 Tax=Artemisia annua TaxID=35608 RepID=A0A2U1P5N0_ARTAN|nr:AP180 N-terminal homology (ANTH) domain-containing protein [Artemisia annua]
MAGVEEGEEGPVIYRRRRLSVQPAKVSSDYKELDKNIFKATNHVERPAKERHIRVRIQGNFGVVFGFLQLYLRAISATRPRADVAYCIHALARRLSKTHNWAVALKTLIVIHRALREVDPTFQEELLNYGRNRNHVLNLSYFKDDSSPNAWDYSGWVRTYALYLEERLECFRVLKYDVETDRPRTKDLDTPELLEQLPALQQLLFRVLGCQPQGAAVHNFVIQLALSMVASESMKIYNAISDGSVNLVDKALDIYRRAGQQAERLSEFYEICKNLDIGRGDRFIKIEQCEMGHVACSSCWCELKGICLCCMPIGIKNNRCRGFEKFIESISSIVNALVY